MKRNNIITALVFGCFIAVSAGTSQAASTAPTTTKAAHAQKAAVKKFYVCTMCKAYYTPAQAKKYGYKCPECGMDLVAKTTIPAGFAKGE
jgi:DNA-directed RNA polymerase subunit RPC12/RpoP